VQKGYLFIFEGPDGVGKTSLSKVVQEQLTLKGKDSVTLSFPGKQAGTLGAVIYNIHHQPTSFNIKSLHPASRQVLHIAAHIEAIQDTILPLLKEGKIVLLDRYWWSTVVYGKAEGINTLALDAMIQVESYFWENKLPDGVFLLSREHSLKKELSLYQWKELKTRYTQLKIQEAAKYPIFDVANETTIQETSDQIVSKILEIIHHANTS